MKTNTPLYNKIYIDQVGNIFCESILEKELPNFGNVFIKYEYICDYKYITCVDEVANKDFSYYYSHLNSYDYISGIEVIL